MDVLHDTSHATWYQLGTKHAALIPPYVLDYTIPEKTAANECADDVRELFPVDSPAATWLSAAYFAKNADVCGYATVLREYVETQIKQAADAYGIRADVDAIMAAVREDGMAKTAEATDGDYGYVVKSAEGTVLDRKYPLFNADDVQKAAEYFAEHRNKYPLEMRRTIASNIMKRAEQFAVKGLPAIVRKEAGVGFPRRDTLMAELLERAHLLKNAELQEALCNINELVAALPMEEIGGELNKLAETLDEFDRAAGMHRLYGKRLLSPAEILFDLDPKTAEAQIEDTVELNNHVFSLSKLAELPASVYAETLGDDFVDRVSIAGKIQRAKLADELNSLPRPDRIALEYHLQHAFA